MKRICFAIAIWVIALGSSPAGAAGLPRRSMLGLAIAPAPENRPGVLVTAVVPGGPGAKAGFQAGDVILSQDGAPAVLEGFPQRIAAMPAGRKIHFDMLRAGKKRTLDAVTAERPRDPGTAAYRVDYGDVVTLDKRVRVITSHPQAPGRHPALFFLPGLTSASIDAPLNSPDTDSQVLYELANAGFVTVRADKPGVGDSEGGPYAKLDFVTEADAYRQALLALKQMPDVDSTRIYLFGHSMGGAFAPLLASEISVRGVVVYGTVARTWHEYLLDVVRHQGRLAGETYADVDDSVRAVARMLELILDDRQSPGQVQATHPELAGLVAENFPDDLYYGRSLEFWRQLERTNFASLWSSARTHVLAVHGESDYVSYAVDHELIAQIVNDAHPGQGRYVSLPSSDHWLGEWPSEIESKKHAGTGKYNPAFAKLVRDWTGEVEGATP
jgi:pimeloyl-ACP methyl ester carboxylesterase